MAMALMRKIDPVDILHLFRGTWHGGMWDPKEHRFAMFSVPIATQMLHAAGFGIAAKLDGAKTVALACFGDGATSEGDSHEAMNFAGVWRAPVVFFCQNNQYAISVPLLKQTAAPTIAVKALGYGFPGVRVDGNDVLGTYAVTKEAVRRAREGNDPTRYRSNEELHEWEALDPIARFEKYCESEGVLSPEFKQKCEDEGKEAA